MKLIWEPDVHAHNHNHTHTFSPPKVNSNFQLVTKEYYKEELAYQEVIDGTNKAKGVETEVTFDVTDKLRINANYTFTQVDKALDRLIPKHKANASLNYQPNSRTLFNVCVIVDSVM